MAYKGLTYKIEYLNNQPGRKGLVFIAASLALVFPVVALFLSANGIIPLPLNAGVLFIAFYSGAITIAIALAFSLPAIVKYARGIFVTGMIVGYNSRVYAGTARHYNSYFVVEYEAGGNSIEKTFLFLPVKNKGLGAKVALLVDKKNPSKAMTENWPKLVGIITVVSFFLTGFLFLPILFFFYIPTLVRAKRSEKVAGEIVDITNGYESYSPVIEYTFGGKKYKTAPNSWSSLKPAIGAPLKIKVDSNNPENIVTKGNFIFSVFALCVFSLAGIAFASIGFFAKGDYPQPVDPPDFPFLGFAIWIGLSSIFFWIGVGLIISSKVKARRQKNIQALKERGLRVYCKVKGAKLNESVIVNGAHPLLLVCEGRGRKFTLKTKIPLHEKAPKVGSAVIVYLDERNDKNYFVDLSTLEAPDFD